MPVFRGSRYEGVKFTGVLGEDGRVRKFLHAREPLRLNNIEGTIVIHSLQRGDELDALAHRASGKPRLWWVLGDVNDVLFPLGLEAGRELAVPVVELSDRREFGSI